MDNPEETGTFRYRTHRKKTNNTKTQTMCVGHHYAQITQITQIRHKPSYKQPKV